MGQHSCPLNIGYTIKAPGNFAKRIYRDPPLPTILEFLQPHIHEEQNSWRQNIVTDIETIMQPVFWAYMQETQV